MSSQNPQIYEQLAWLVRSELPLPEAIAQLAKDARSSQTKQTFTKLEGSLRSGDTLASAMRQQPEQFRTLYVNLVEAGERHGFLAEMLQEVSNLARFELTLGHRLRERLAYPCLSLVFGILVASGFLIWVVPGFDAMFQEFTIDRRLPPLTECMLALSRLFNHSTAWVIAANALMLLACIWLFSRFGMRAFSKILGCLPGTHYLWRLLDYSRLSAVLAVGIRYGLPLQEALATAATLVQSRKLRALLSDWTHRSKQGETLTTLLVQSSEVDQLFALALKHAPEAELQGACVKLAEMYREEAERYLDRFVLLASGVIITIVGCAVGMLVLGLFTPFIQIINTLAAD